MLRFSTPTDPVIDIGGGDNHGRRTRRIQLSKRRFSTCPAPRSNDPGPARQAADNVAWIRADITDWEPTSTWSFHGTTSLPLPRRPRRSASCSSTPAKRAIATGERLVLATFAPDGPEQCAGLPVQPLTGLAGYRLRRRLRLVERGDVGQGVEVGDRRPYVAVVMQMR
ncbi:MAG: hypothetical protein R2715_24915 [Ilumatobacteraceae bacterium]